MTHRITNRDLESLVNRINKAKGTPATYSDPNTKKFSANVGNYHLDMAYGGNQLVQTANTSGGITTISYGGYVPKRDLYDQMRAMLAMIE